MSVCVTDCDLNCKGEEDVTNAKIQRVCYCYQCKDAKNVLSLPMQRQIPDWNLLMFLRVRLSPTYWSTEDDDDDDVDDDAADDDDHEQNFLT